MNDNNQKCVACNTILIPISKPSVLECPNKFCSGKVQTAPPMTNNQQSETPIVYATYGKVSIGDFVFRLTDKGILIHPINGENGLISKPLRTISYDELYEWKKVAELAIAQNKELRLHLGNMLDETITTRRGDWPRLLHCVECGLGKSRHKLDCKIGLAGDYLDKDDIALTAYQTQLEKEKK